VLEYSKGGLEASVESECCYRGVAGTYCGGARTFGLNHAVNGFASCENDSFTDGQYPQFLFLEPNASDPLNKEAAEDLRSNREGFKRNIRTSMSGGAIKSQQYERVIGR